MKPEEFLDLAKNIVNANSNQAQIRTSISRIYYSVFLESRELFISMGAKFSKSANVHKEVEDLIKNSGCNGNDAYKESNLLFNLRKMRNEADYDLPDKFSFSDVEDALKYSGEILNYLHSGKFKKIP
ncbi:MAG: HEPN domain-containing protein [Ferroplasma sp.]